MQFSLYDLPQLGYVESEETHYNLIDPSATQDTDIFFDNFNFIYTLLADELPPLKQLGPGRELVFALGAQEITAQIGADNTLEFNPAQLVLLESEDYLAIRLYQNGNDENILWEYAYGFLPQGGPDDHQVSADDHVVDLYFYLPYKVNESTPNPKKVTIKWQVEGPGGVVEEETQSSTDGLYNNRLFVSTNPGDEYWVTAEITDSEDPRFMVGQTTTIGPITVIPGEPQTLLLTPSQTTFAADMTSEITVDLFAVDAFGNPVADNSKVDWNIVGDVTETSPVTNGQATVTYHAQSLTGTAKITANIGNSYGQTQVVIDPPGGLNLAIDPRLVIGDQSSDGIHVDETLTGTMALAYNTTTDMVITGIPGETVQVDLEGNIEPIAWYFMDYVRQGDIVADIYHDHDAVAHNVTRDSSLSTHGDGSLFSNGDAHVEIAHRRRWRRGDVETGRRETGDGRRARP
jgi:hypothetical protein